MKTELRELVDTLAGLVWTTTLDGSSDFFNDTWVRFTGLPREQSCVRDWMSAVHAEDVDLVRNVWETVSPDAPRELDARLRRRDGEYRWFRIRASRLDSGAESLWCWLAVQNDEMDATGQQSLLDARLRRLVDSMPTQVVFMSPDLRHVEYVNREALSFYGKTLEELQKWAEPEGPNHPDDLRAIEEKLERMRSHGEPWDNQSRHRRADGEFRWIRSRMLPMRDAQGNVVRYFSVQNEVHDLKWAEDLLAGEVRILEMVARGEPLPEILNAICRLAEELTVGGCVCSILRIAADRAHFEVAAGPNLPDACGRLLNGMAIDPTADPCSQSIADKAPVVAPDLLRDRRWTQSSWRAHMEGNKFGSCWSMPILSASGEAAGTFSVYRKQVANPTPDERQLIDRFTKIAGIAMDRAKSDAALRSSESALRQALNQLAEAQRLTKTGSFTSDIRTDRHSWSDEYYRIFELDRTAPPSVQLIRDRVHPDDLAEFDTEIQRGRDGNESDFTFRIRTPQGGLKYLRGIARVIDQHDGRPIFMGMVQDITEATVREEALSTARSELAHISRITTLSTLTASIAHEVNQPLFGLVTNASTSIRMLTADPPNIEGAVVVAHRITRDANRASEVIRRLRGMFSRKSNSKQNIDLNEAAREILLLSSGEVHRGKATAYTKLEEGLPAIYGDRVQIQQVVLNLVLNAVEAMRDFSGPKSLWISTAREEGRVRLDVRDSGPGVEAEQLEKLFGAFYTTKPQGMGVGLSISRSIIEAHHGWLWATLNDGPGLTFSFSLPISTNIAGEIEGHDQPDRGAVITLLSGETAAGGAQYRQVSDRIQFLRHRQA